MQLTFNIPEEKKDLFIEAWSEGYQEEIGGEPNPQTRAQFAKEQIKEILSERVRYHESTQIPEIGIT